MNFDFDALLRGPFVGCLAIGTSAAMLLLLNGRILGVSGIAGTLVTFITNPKARERAQGEFTWRLAFVGGLLAGGVFLALTSDVFSRATPVATQPWHLVVAGLLVGVGTRLGLGCTSGHGICGLGRFSGRSLLATTLFMGTGIAVVALVNRLVTLFPASSPVMP